MPEQRERPIGLVWHLLKLTVIEFPPVLACGLSGVLIIPREYTVKFPGWRRESRMGVP